MKRPGKTFNAIIALLAAGGLVIVGDRAAFARQEGGNYTLTASDPGYDNRTVPDAAEPSQMPPNRPLYFSMGENVWVEKKPAGTMTALSWETGTGKSYLIPALEIPAFLFLLNGYDRLAYPNMVEPSGEKTYSVNLSTFRDHLIHGPWGVDTDAFNVNQFMHPYQGSMYQGFARSVGLNYWESLLYTNVGSFLRETGGETSYPSINDQFASGIGGDDPGGRGAIDRLSMGLTYRVFGRHALGIQYNTSLRDVRYPERADSYQAVDTVSLVYTYLGSFGFGAVEWRDAGRR